ncbi:unnamed protein product [Auanema sp. JU1783]|nr:unnamed protein product [Auanema sp. JU1783]
MGKSEKQCRDFINEWKPAIEKFGLFDRTREELSLKILQIHEVKAALKSMDSIREKWGSKDAEVHKLRSDNDNLYKELMANDVKLKTVQAELMDARSQIRIQLDQNSALKADLEEYDKKLIFVRDILKNSLPSEKMKELAFLKNPGLIRTHSTRLAKQSKVEVEIEDDTTSDNLDYDQTGDSMDLDDDENSHCRRSSGVRGKRSSAALNNKRNRSRVITSPIDEEEVENEAPRKKSKEYMNQSIVRLDIETSRPSRSTKVTIRRSLNRSMSEGRILEDIENKRHITLKGLQSTPHATSTLDLRKHTPGSARSWTSKGPLERREHSFEKLSTYFKMTNCDVCHGGINFAAKPAMKCKDCHQHVHVTCGRKLALPCIPRSATPIKTPSKSRGQTTAYRLKDFCPLSSPMIAYPIIHCVVALENRGLHHEGIYRVPGKKSQVTAVLNELRNSRAIPKLELQDIEVISDCIKQFLMELRDPLIPKSSREEFVRAALTTNYTALNVAIFDLPQPNRDTLAYLILHWQKVIGHCQQNKMPKENVARCVALSVMGRSSYARGDLGSASRETGELEKVLLALLTISPVYWQKFINQEALSAGMLSAVSNTNESCESPSPVDRSMLGPVKSSPQSTPYLIRTRRQKDRLFDAPNY